MAVHNVSLDGLRQISHHAGRGQIRSSIGAPRPRAIRNKPPAERLQEELGVQLFNKQGRKLLLTE